MRFFTKIIVALLILSINNASARERLSDVKDLCEKKDGVWREFGNNCADSCYQQNKAIKICTSAIVFGCECGENRCWDGQTCISDKKYKSKLEEIRINLEKTLELRTALRKSVCEETGGKWKDFQDSCVDSCKNQENSSAMCANIITPSCDCKSTQCWTEDGCVAIEDYVRDPYDS